MASRQSAALKRWNIVGDNTEARAENTRRAYAHDWLAAKKRGAGRAGSHPPEAVSRTREMDAGRGFDGHVHAEFLGHSHRPH